LAVAKRTRLVACTFLTQHWKALVCFDAVAKYRRLFTIMTEISRPSNFIQAGPGNFDP
jgi:hypothetical protein